MIFRSFAHNQSFKLCPLPRPFGGAHPSFFCPRMKGSIDVENCCLVISYIPLSSISAVLLLHLRDTAEKSLLCATEATGLKFHCWRGRLRRNKSGFNTTHISNYQVWAERTQKTRRDRKGLGILQSFPFGMKSSSLRLPRQKAWAACTPGVH